MKKIHIIFFTLVFILIVFPMDLEAQCAMCKAAVESSMNQQNSVAKGINKGILYLMAVPYLLLMFIFRKQIASLWKQLVSKSK